MTRTLHFFIVLALGVGVIFLTSCASTPPVLPTETLTVDYTETLVAEAVKGTIIADAVVGTVSAIQSLTPLPTGTSLPTETPTSTSTPTVTLNSNSDEEKVLSAVAATFVAEAVGTIIATSLAAVESAKVAIPTRVTRDPLLGLAINPWLEGHAPSIEDLNNLGAGWVRFVVYDDKLDQLGEVLRRYRKAGFGVILVVNQETFPQNGENFWNYTARFAQGISELVTAHGHQVAAWEIWNEPEDSREWKYLSEDDYLVLLEKSYDKIKEVSPQTVVLATGYAGAVNTIRGENREVLGQRLRCDGYVYHPYGEKVDGFPSQYLGVMTETLSAVYQTTGVPIWVTEFGVPLEHLGEEAEADQARYLTRAVAEFRQLSFVRVAIYFAWTDLNHRDNGDRYGLVDANGRRRAVYHAFSWLTYQ